MVIRLAPAIASWGPAESAAAWERVPPHLRPRPDEAALLAPDHPFLAHGTWRGFAADGPGEGARLVAGLDPRQRDGRGRPVGTLGFARGGGRALAALVDEALAWLAARGAAVVRAPVHLSTWFGHRLRLDMEGADAGEPLFPREPAADPALAEVLAAAGFEVAHRATTRAVGGGPALDRAGRAWQRAVAAGLTDHPPDPRRAAEDLAAVHRLAVEAFEDAWGSAPISLTEFLAVYAPLAAANVTGGDVLVRLVRDAAGDLIGCVLAYRQPPGRPFVVKSLFVAPAAQRRHPGLGAALAWRVHVLLATDESPSGLHALMAADGPADRTSAHLGGRVVARYATFERFLSAAEAG